MWQMVSEKKNNGTKHNETWTKKKEKKLTMMVKKSRVLLKPLFCSVIDNVFVVQKFYDCSLMESIWKFGSTYNSKKKKKRTETIAFFFAIFAISF